MMKPEDQRQLEEEHLDVISPLSGDKPSELLGGMSGVLVPFRCEILQFLVPSPSLNKGRKADRTLTIWYEDGRGWKACLRCKSAMAMAFVTADSIGELFYELSRGMRKESLKWREDKGHSG